MGCYGIMYTICRKGLLKDVYHLYWGGEGYYKMCITCSGEGRGIIRCVSPVVGMGYYKMCITCSGEWGIIRCVSPVVGMGYYKMCITCSGEGVIRCVSPVVGSGVL